MRNVTRSVTHMTSRDRFLVYLALASALFVFIVAELLPVGLMPQMSADLQVEPSSIGLLVSAYAVTAAVLGLPVAWACRRWGNRVVLGGCLIWLAIGQVVLAVAPTLSVALVARVAVAGAHVVVWGIAPLAAAKLEEPGRQGRATGRVLIGGTLGTLLGVPAATLLGQHLGWRTAAWAVAALAAVTAVVILRFLPDRNQETNPSATSRPRGVNGRVLWIIAATVLGIGALQAYYPYLSEYAASSHITGAGFATLLVGMGAAGAIGVYLTSRVIDNYPKFTVVAVFAVGALLPPLFLHSWPGTVFGVLAVVWGLSVAAAPVVLQTGTIKAAGPQAELASSAYVVAFQIGIALGAWVGGYASIYLAAGTLAAALIAMIVMLAVRDPATPGSKMNAPVGSSVNP